MGSTFYLVDGKAIYNNVGENGAQKVNRGARLEFPILVEASRAHILSFSRLAKKIYL